VLICLVIAQTVNGQKKFKFAELPPKLQKAVMNSLQANLSDSVQIKQTFISDTVSAHDTKNTFWLYNFHIKIDTSDNAELDKIVIRCIRYKYGVGAGEDFSSLLKRPSLLYDPRYVTTGKLSFTCLDTNHNPHHSATTLKEMRKLRDKYNCKKISTFILDN
jgi:hypothetical protein